MIVTEITLEYFSPGKAAKLWSKTIFFCLRSWNVTKRFVCSSWKSCKKGPRWYVSTVVWGQRTRGKNLPKLLSYLGEPATSELLWLCEDRRSWECTMLQGRVEGRGGMSGVELPRLPCDELRWAAVSWLVSGTADGKQYQAESMSRPSGNTVNSALSPVNHALFMTIITADVWRKQAKWTVTRHKHRKRNPLQQV